MIKKKFISVAMVALISASALFGCGKSSNTETVNPDAAQQVEDASATSSEPAADSENAEAAETNDDSASAEVAAEAASDEASAEVVEVHGIRARSDEMRDISAKELVAEMTAGWNLGNTLEATSASGLASETSWGNPKVTKEQIDAVCEKGFDSIRIPITWGNHVGEAPDYTIDPEWMDRVEEVINYALDDGMYVLIDSHHEEFWRIPDAEHIEAVDAENIAIW